MTTRNYHPHAPAHPGMPAPVGMVGGSSAGKPRPPSNRVQEVSQYALSVTLQGNDLAVGPNTPVECMNVNWVEPAHVTLYSELGGPDFDIFDPSDDSTFDDAQVRMVVEWGDGNSRYRRNINPGVPLDFVCTSLRVTAYLAQYQLLPGDSLPDLSGVLAILNLLAIENQNEDSDSRPIQSRYIAYETTGGLLGANYPWNASLPSQLLSITGFQETGADVYVMLFDHGENGAGVGSTMPLAVFKVPDGENFSFVFDEGLQFIHGGTVVFSTSPDETAPVPVATDPLTIRAQIQYISNTSQYVSDAQGNN